MLTNKKFWLITGLCLVLILGVFGFQQHQQARHQTEAQAQATAETTTGPGHTQPSTAQPSTAGSTGDGFAAPDPDAAQAAEQFTPAPTNTPQSIKQPVTPHPDTEDPEQVARAWLTVFNSRTSTEDTSWEQTGKAWLTPDMFDEARRMGNPALEGRYPTAVKNIKITTNVSDWGRDTPVRWAHYAEVTVATEHDGDMLVKFRIRSQYTDQGWLINSSPIDSWKKTKG